jgi:Uma2 family endonuclease
MSRALFLGLNVMATVLTKPMTAEEFFDFVHRPENRDRHFELVKGEVVKVSRPGDRHGSICANSAYILGGYTRAIKKGHVTTNDTGIILERHPDTVRGADVAVYMERVRYRQLKVKYSARLPKVIIEVLSPNDRMGKMLKRIAKFLKKGVGMAWLLDPEDETLTIFMPNKEPIVLERDEEVSGLKLLPDFRCKVADFFVMPGE